MVSVSELFNTWKEGFANKDSSKLAELVTDDFQFISPRRPMNKQETLDWTAGGGNPTAIDNLEVLYENDEVGVIYHSASNNNNDGVAMTFTPREATKFPRAELSERLSKMCTDVKPIWQHVALNSKTGRGDPVSVRL